MRTIARVGLTLIAGFLAASGTSAAPAEKLGAVSFANTCSEAVQPRLQRAVALLHSFWWSEGDTAFRDVLVEDPSCAIAGWGIAALAIGNPYATGPTPEGAKRAQEAIAQARAIGAKSERERGYIEAVAAYYDNFAERPHAVRLRSMADAFEALASSIPMTRRRSSRRSISSRRSHRATRPSRERCRVREFSKRNSRSTATIRVWR